MAFVKLFPKEGGRVLEIETMLTILEGEFEYFDADREAGKEHVAAMLAAIAQVSDSLPGKRERMEELLSVQEKAVVVSFGPSEDACATCCITSGLELFFGQSDEVDGDLRPHVERAACVLSYVAVDG